MTATYDVNNPANWEQIYNNSFQATYVQGQQVPIYTPIPKTELALNIDSPVLAIYCTSTQYQDAKKYLGSVYQSVIGNGSFPTATLSARGKSLYSNETVFAEFLDFDDNYNLTLNVRWWIEQINITIFKYIGIIDVEIQNRLTTIEAKIDQLL